jgi:hypothetical protein
MRGQEDRNAAIVIGSGELGSAIAVALHEAAFRVVLCDEVDPVGLRRGMSFTDAWYVGSATLGGVRATFCASARSIPTVLTGRRSIAATTWSWRGVAALLSPAVIVDARCQAAGVSPSDLRIGMHRDVLTVGLSPWYVTGENASTVVWAPLTAGDAPVYDPLGAEPHRTALASKAGGRMHTLQRIGDRVHAGEVIGGVGVTTIMAPVGGVLSGLAARGSRIAAGATVAEIDRRAQAVLCFGIPEWCARIADEIVELACGRQEDRGQFERATGLPAGVASGDDHRVFHT